LSQPHRLVVSLLKKFGVDADLASEGAQAIAAPKVNRYDLVLMDVASRSTANLPFSG